MSHAWLALVLVVPLAFVPGCKKKSDNLRGVGTYKFGESTLADAEKVGRCIPLGEEPDVVQCLGMPDPGLEGNSTIFYSKKTGQLQEIAVDFRVCDPVEMAAKLEKMIGMPPSSTLKDGQIRMWKLPQMFVSARLRVGGTAECSLNFVAPTDTKRIADLENDR